MSVPYVGWRLSQWLSHHLPARLLYKCAECREIRKTRVQTVAVHLSFFQFTVFSRTLWAHFYHHPLLQKTDTFQQRNFFPKRCPQNFAPLFHFSNVENVFGVHQKKPHQLHARRRTEQFYQNIHPVILYAIAFVRHSSFVHKKVRLVTDLLLISSF